MERCVPGIMIRFFSDLDNTLIYSHRKRINGLRICVENLHGKQQSYMSLKTFDYFKSQEWMSVIPVTTRTYEQYQRLDGIAKILRWHFALICNGSVLLIEGKEEMKWRKESIILSEKDQPAFEELYRKACELYGICNVVLVDGIMFYVRRNGDQDAYETLRMHSNPAHVLVLKDARKTYCFPITLSKGNAIKRFENMMGDLFSVAAGDSLEFDITMSDYVDIFLCPEKFQENNGYKNNLIKCKGFFSDTICDELENIRLRNNL